VSFAEHLAAVVGDPDRWAAFAACADERAPTVVRLGELWALQGSIGDDEAFAEAIEADIGALEHELGYEGAS